MVTCVLLAGASVSDADAQAGGAGAGAGGSAIQPGSGEDPARRLRR